MGLPQLAIPDYFEARYGELMMIDRNYQPIFLVGSVRSGTTLLRLMLDHHPDLAFHHESEFIVTQVPRSHQLWPNMNDYWDWLESDRIFLHSNFSIDRSLPYPDLVKSFLAQKQARDGKPLVGATVHIDFDILPRIWPDAKYIHLVRDPRDVSRSVIQMGWAGNYWHAADTWRIAEKCWDRLLGLIPNGSFIEIHYEDLIRDHFAELTRICHFIGIDYSGKMLDYASNSTYGLPDPTLTEQWKSKLSNAEISIVEAKCHELMTLRNYDCVITPVKQIPSLKQFYFNLQSWIYRVAFRRKRYGLRLLLKDFIGRRLHYSKWRRETAVAIREIDEQHIR